jgi:hypothetical protein
MKWSATGFFLSPVIAWASLYSDVWVVEADKAVGFGMYSILKIIE